MVRRTASDAHSRAAQKKIHDHYLSLKTLTAADFGLLHKSLQRPILCCLHLAEFAAKNIAASVIVKLHFGTTL